MGWKDTLAKIYKVVNPRASLSDEDRALAAGVEAADKREAERLKREKADADAKAARLRWSPKEANEKMKERYGGDE